MLIVTVHFCTSYNSCQIVSPLIVVLIVVLIDVLSCQQHVTKVLGIVRALKVFYSFSGLSDTVNGM